MNRRIGATNGAARAAKTGMAVYFWDMKIMGGPIRWLIGALIASWFVIGTALWLLSGPSGREVVAASAGTTVVLAFGIWWLSGRVPLPSTPRPTFLGLHAFGALMFGSAMILVTYGVQAAVQDTSLREAARAANFLGAEFVFWIWLYALLVAGSYGSRYRTVLMAEREAAARAEARAAEARLETLRGQLNPHFLFNALHSVAALVRNDAARAELAIERLGDLLRFSLDEAGDSKVALASELRFTRTYLELERLGLGDRLNVEFDVDESALDANVPPFTLQVLAENAVRHGIAPLPMGGRIDITIRNKTNGVELTVMDDGSGSKANGNTTGRGLTNLKDRLVAFYGTSAKLVTGPKPDGGFMARLEIPRS